MNAESHLRSLGWRGPGTGLQPHSIPRALLVTRKNNLGGLGSGKDEGEWWDKKLDAGLSAINIIIPAPSLKRKRTKKKDLKKSMEEGTTKTKKKGTKDAVKEKKRSKGEKKSKSSKKRKSDPALDTREGTSETMTEKKRMSRLDLFFVKGEILDPTRSKPD